MQQKIKHSAEENIQHTQGTFFLDHQDLEQFFRAFCYMAKIDVTSSMPSATAKRERQKKKADTSTTADTTIPIQRPWEDEKVTLSISDFFATFQPASERSKSWGFMDSMFDLVGTNDIHAMTYGEFLAGVCTFGMFKLDDMIKFIFFTFDKDKEGRLPRFQLLRFVESIHGKKIRVFEQAILPNDKASASLSKGNNLRLPAAERKKTSVDYDALRKLCNDYPTMLEPMLIFQTALRRRIMGEVWWKRKENQIEKHFRTLDQTREEKRRREEKRLLKERKEKILSDIGYRAYYSKSKARSEIEKEHPKPIVTLEEETGKICVEWTRTDGKDDDDVSAQPD